MSWPAFLVGVASSIVAGWILGILSVMVSKPYRAIGFLYTVLPRRLVGRLEYIYSRVQYYELFAEVFMQDLSPNGHGRILLMSDYGGYPEFDASGYLRSAGATGHRDIVAAVNTASFRSWAEADLSRAIDLVSQPNIRIVIFDNLAPHRFRIGVNTEKSVAFICFHYGHSGNKVRLQGICGRSEPFVACVSVLFDCLLLKGTRVSKDWIEKNCVPTTTSP